MSHKGIQFKCYFKDCLKSFYRKDYLKEHQKSKHNVSGETKTYFCQRIGCGKQFKNNIHLRDHQRVHKSGKYQCEYEGCYKVFYNKYCLNTHLNRHSDRFVCDYENCGFRAVTNYELNRHKEIHSKPRFNCELN